MAKTSAPTLVPFYCEGCKRIIVYTFPSCTAWCSCGRRAKRLDDETMQAQAEGRGVRA